MLDNTVVRQGWKAAKTIVTDILDKHEAKTITARRWDERRLSYPIKRRGRATYMISYFELAKDGGTALSRSLELNEAVLRYLITRVDVVPTTEAELASREDSDDFVVPAPPVEEAPVIVEEEAAEEEKSSDKPTEESGEDDSASEEATTEKASTEEAATEEATKEPVAAVTSTDESKSEEPKSGEEA